MKDIISQIIEMDKKARDFSDAAKRAELISEHEIYEHCDEIRNNYLEEARHRICVNRENELARAKQKWAEKEEYYKTLEAQMKENFSQNSEKWTDAIVRNVLEAK